MDGEEKQIETHSEISNLHKMYSSTSSGTRLLFCCFFFFFILFPSSPFSNWMHRHPESWVSSPTIDFILYIQQECVTDTVQGCECVRVQTKRIEIRTPSKEIQNYWKYIHYGFFYSDTNTHSILHIHIYHWRLISIDCVCVCVSTCIGNFIDMSLPINSIIGISLSRHCHRRGRNHLHWFVCTCNASFTQTQRHRLNFYDGQTVSQ